MKRDRASSQPRLAMPVSLWARLPALRDAVGKVLVGCPEELRRAAMMTVTELAENGLKYGKDVRVTVELRRKAMSISVTNAGTTAANVARAQRHIARIAREKNPESLYLARMHELMQDETQTGRLGLFRVVGEGKFRLKCAYTNRTLTVTATRSLDAPKKR